VPHLPAVLEGETVAVGPPFGQRGRDVDLDLEGDRGHWRGRDARGEPLELRDLPLLTLPMPNAALALQAYALLGQPWQPDVIARTLAAARVSGRLERRTLRYRGRNVSLLLDVAHNPHAAAYLAQRLEPLGGRRLAVF